MTATRERTLGYCLQVLLAAGCVLLPVLLQGLFNFIDCGVMYYVLWTAWLTAIWLRFRLPAWWWLPALFVSFIYSGYVLSQHNDVGYNEVSAILDTNIGEALELMRAPSMFIALCAVVAGYAVLCWVLCRDFRWGKLATPSRLDNRMLYVVMAVCVVAYVMAGSGWNKQQMYPANVICEGYRFIREVQYAKYKYARLNYTYAGPDAGHRPPKLTAVIVVGESARAASWSLYGYGRPTNPQVADCFNKSNGRGVLFTDALSAGRLTMNAVPSLLSPTTANDFQNYCSKPSLIGVFRAAGCRTSVISSHMRASEFWDGSVNLMLGAAASIVKLAQDAQLPAALDEWSGNDARPQRLAVMHMFGSHYDYGDRYPASFNLFHGGDVMVDTYDNSIAFTDHVLAGIIRGIDDMPAPAVMFYTSDHGENLNDFGDGNIQHSCREFTRYEIEVPMFFYANQAFVAAYPQEMAAIKSCASLPVSHDNIAQTMLGLAGLTDPQVYLPKYDMSNKNFAPQPRFLIQNLRENISEAAIRNTPHGRRVPFGALHVSR